MSVKARLCWHDRGVALGAVECCLPVCDDAREADSLGADRVDSRLPLPYALQAFPGTAPTFVLDLGANAGVAGAPLGT